MGFLMEIFLVSFQMHTATFNKSKVNIHLSQRWCITYFMLSYVVMTFYFFGPSVFINFPPCSIKIMKNHPTQGKKSETVSLACSVVHGAELFWQAPAPGFSFLRSRSLCNPVPAFGSGLYVISLKSSAVKIPISECNNVLNFLPNIVVN